jgi:ABC-type Co2+ transport system permease subunit
MATVPLWTWLVGIAVLAIVLAYGILRNRTRTRQERAISNSATKELYRQEDRSS